MQRHNRAICNAVASLYDTSMGRNTSNYNIQGQKTMNIEKLLAELTKADYALEAAMNRGDSAAANKYSAIIMAIDADIERYKGELPELELQ